jgi:DNA polymerase-3 subunit gamma/tau
MLGLADRGRILDLFEKLMAGKIAEALAELRELYERGADPLVVMQDLLETTHFLTRVKVAPGAEGFFDGGSGEARRSAEIAGKLSVPSLTRAWQMLLKGLIEVRDATQPLAACEMALIRLAYAAELPPTDKLVRDVLDSGSAPPARVEGGSKSSPQISPRGPESVASQRGPESVRMRGEPSAQTAVAAEASEAPVIRNLEDLAALAQANGSPVLKVQIENNMRLVRLEPGQLEFAPTPSAPRTLAGDLAQKLKEWTGVRWSVIVAREGGQPTLAEQKRSAKAARLESVLQEPFVRAVLDRFPGAEVIAVRDLAEEDIAAPLPDKES